MDDYDEDEAVKFVDEKKKELYGYVLEVDDDIEVGFVPAFVAARHTEVETWKIVLTLSYFGSEPTGEQLEVPILKFHADFGDLLRSGEHFDVTLCVQGEEINAHKAVLVARSDYFKAMFTPGFMENESKKIIMDDTEPGTFKNILNYIYSDATPLFADESCLDLLCAADKYGIIDLKDKLEKLIDANLTGENIVEVLLLAEKHDFEALKRKAMKKFPLYAGALLSREEKWDKLQECPSILRKLLLLLNH